MFLLRCGELVLMKKLRVGSKLQCGVWCALTHSFGDGLGISHVSVPVPSCLSFFLSSFFKLLNFHIIVSRKCDSSGGVWMKELR